MGTLLIINNIMVVRKLILNPKEYWYKPIVYIKNKSDFDAFMAGSNYWSHTRRIELLADIDCEGTSYVPSTFKGDFNGNNHIISNATFGVSEGRSGMFQGIGNSQRICNFTLSNITTNSLPVGFSGALCGKSDGDCLIQNVQVRNSSSTGFKVGALVGQATGGTIQYCSSRDCSVISKIEESDEDGAYGIGGGLVGEITAVITDCYSTVIPTAGVVGGIAGSNLMNLGSENYLYGTITWCWCSCRDIIGSGVEDTISNILTNVDSDTDRDDMKAWGNGRPGWSLKAGTNSDFIISQVTYKFE